jgi:hypothetical protein
VVIYELQLAQSCSQDRPITEVLPQRRILVIIANMSKIEMKRDDDSFEEVVAQGE